MGPNLERTIRTSGVVHCSYADALKLLHDPIAMIKLNPLVTDHQRHASEQDTYLITDKLKIFGITKMQTYKAKVEKVDDGITFHVDAGSVTSTNHWKLRQPAISNDGKIEVLEEAHVKTLFLLMPYVASSIRQSHKVLMERLTLILEGKEVPPNQITTGEAQAGCQ